MCRKKRIFLLVLCFLLTLSIYAQEDLRYALVIGNGEYQHTTKLANPVNDASDIAGALEQFGFSVNLVQDATAGEMEEAIREFTSSVSLAGAETALFYYAGHGVQYEGINYLIPINADVQESYELKDQAVSMNRVSDGLTQAGSMFNLILLDACRDNPFSTSRSSSRGLSVIGAGGRGNMVVFATSPGDVAQDGTGRNSPFTSALLEHIKTPNSEIREMITEVQRTVQFSTSGAQIPWMNTSFTGEFYFQTAEDQLNRSQVELNSIQEELVELEREIAEREKAIDSAENSTERQRLEVEQQRARALEESKQLETERLSELQRQAEEILSSQQAQDALREEMQQRLALQQDELTRQATLRKDQLDQLRTQAEITDNLMDRLEGIVQLQNAIRDLTVRYQEIIDTTMAQLDELTAQRTNAYRVENPRDPWETAKEHEQRLQERISQFEATNRAEKQEQRQDFESRLAQELAILESKLTQARDDLNGRRFRPASEEMSVVVQPFNTEEKYFPINFQVSDKSVSYTIPLSYAIESRERDVLREEYYRVFSAYESNALIGQSEYAVFEMQPNLWCVFSTGVEVVNLLEDDAAFISQSTGQDVRIGNPLIMFRTTDTVERVYSESLFNSKVVLITGLPTENTVSINGIRNVTEKQSLIVDSSSLSSQFKITASGQWLTEEVTIEINRQGREQELVWVDFSDKATSVGELFIPKSDLIVHIEDSTGENRYSAEAPAVSDILIKLEPDLYTVAFKQPNDPYFSETERITIEVGKRITLDPGVVGLSTLYQQELKLKEKSELEQRMKTNPLIQTASYGFLGLGAVGIIGSVVSYLLYADAVDNYHNAVITEEAQNYRNEATLWSTLFSVSVGFGAGGGALGGYLAATTPSRFSLENEMQEIERQIKSLNDERAARKAQEARDAFMERTGE